MAMIAETITNDGARTATVRRGETTQLIPIIGIATAA
eukprot:CAMPEP_0172300758 /NCGR_PEP_ID=MMETSP1058-20130122/2786_1 /TAXON_ID=83371 /ORGANISM="Detonula confervacea, Strain CCMP 353" /LENGTH=36 /DNA_ID= /DNA_START= /DNA_END= /DNA_ORIENTATION=